MYVCIACAFVLHPFNSLPRGCFLIILTTIILRNLLLCIIIFAILHMVRLGSIR